MPSTLHEILIELFRSKSDLAPELLTDVFGVDLPEFVGVRTEDAQLTEIVPTEYRADLVVLLMDEKPVYGIVIEVQLQRDEEKRFSWPVYASVLRSKFRCPVNVLVVTPEASVAAWASEPMYLSYLDNPFRVVVLGPDSIPWIRRGCEEVSPELAVLSALAHGNDSGGLEVVLAALAATSGLDRLHSRIYYDQIVASLGDAVYKELSAMLEQGEYEWQSKLVKQWVREGRERGLEEGRERGLEEGRERGLEEGRERGLEEGRERGLEEGRERGLEEGRERGLEEGRASEAKRSIFTALEVRGIVVPAKVREQIESCSDLNVLEQWLRNAIIVTSVADIFQSR